MDLKDLIAMAGGDGSVGNLVNDPSLIDNAKATLQKVEKATEGLEDQGPLSVIGLAVGFLLGLLLRQHQIPEHLHNFATLALVCFAFAADIRDPHLPSMPLF